MKHLFAVAYIIIGLVVATRIRNVSARFALAYPNMPEHGNRERIACWFQLVFALFLLVCSVRFVARWAIERNAEQVDTPVVQAASIEPPAFTESEMAKERLFFDFLFELNPLRKESQPNH